MASTPSGNKYFFVVIDDLSRYMWISLMGSKDKALTSFVMFKSRAEAEPGRKVETLRTDHGGEFTARVCRALHRGGNSLPLDHPIYTGSKWGGGAAKLN
jgi:hypothetical protein